MDRPRCGICYENKLAFDPIHINDRGECITPNPVHSDKYCKECLQDRFEVAEVCPTCNQRFLEPIPFIEDENDEDYVAEGDVIDMDTNDVGGLGNIEPDAIQFSPVRVEPRVRRDPRQNASSTDTHTAGVATIVQPVQQDVQQTTQPTRRTSPITEAERKRLTPTQLGAIMDEIGYPAENDRCAYYILKASKKLPKGFCVEPLSKCTKVDDKWFCEEHKIFGPVELKLRATTEKKIAFKKQKNAKKRARQLELQIEQELLELQQEEEDEEAKAIVNKKYKEGYQEFVRRMKLNATVSQQ